MGHALISARILPESEDLNSSRDCEKWWVHIMPPRRCATANEKRDWKWLVINPKPALKRKAETMRAHNKRRNWSEF